MPEVLSSAESTMYKELLQACGVAGAMVIMVVLVLGIVLKSKLSEKLSAAHLFRLLQTFIIGVFILGISGMCAYAYVNREAKTNQQARNEGEAQGLSNTNKAGFANQPEVQKLANAIVMGDATTATRLIATLPSNTVATARDRNGNTLLHYAAANNRTNIAALLAQKGVSPYATNGTGRTAVRTALAFNHREFTKKVTPTVR